MASSDRYRGRILRPIPYEDGSGGRLVAPVGSYEIAEQGEHLQFFAEDGPVHDDEEARAAASQGRPSRDRGLAVLTAPEDQ